MDFLIKSTLAFLILFLSISGANAANTTLENAQEKTVKTYNAKVMEDRSFKSLKEAKDYINNKGIKVEKIGKELGIDYIMSDDKGLFFYSDGDLISTLDHEQNDSTTQIGWTTVLSEYGQSSSKLAKTNFYENINIYSHADFLNIDNFKNNVAVKFIYKYLTEIEQKNIKYNDFLSDIQKTAQKSVNEYNESGTKMKLLDGLNMTFKSPDKMEIIVTKSYRTRIVKEGNPDFTDYFLSFKNEDELTAKFNAIYDKYYAMNESVGNYEYRGLYDVEIDSSVPIQLGHTGASTYGYNKKLYPNISDTDRLPAATIHIINNKEIDIYEVDIFEFKKHLQDEASLMYDIINTEVYNGSYKISKKDFISKYVKDGLNKTLGIIPNAYAFHEIFYITPGVEIDGGRGAITCNIPVKYN